MARLRRKAKVQEAGTKQAKAEVPAGGKAKDVKVLTREQEAAQEPQEKGMEAGEGKARAHVMISGQVQGVFFRSALRSQAKLFGLNGWTMNTIEGNIEAVFEGDKDRVEKLVAFCWKGPPGALIRDVKVDWDKPKFDLTGFEIRA